MSKIGRPSKLTPETVKKLCDAIRMGATYALACNYAGISYTLYREWMKKGEAAKSGKFFDFLNAIKEAEGKAAVGWLAKIEAAANDGAWQAAAWKLERRYPGMYGRQLMNHEHSGEIGVRYVNDWRNSENE